MNWRAIRTIVDKDLRVVLQNKGVLLPILIVPLILLVLVPAGIGLSTALIPDMAAGTMTDLEGFTSAMPPGVRDALADYTLAQQGVVLLLVYFLAPLYLILPIMVASVIAADSFAGEKERKTLEALLYTPVTDLDLYVAKLLSAWIPATFVAWIGFFLYGITVNLAAWPTMGQIFFPNGMWMLLAFWVAPAAAGMGLGVMVLVSIRAQGFQDAYQIGGLVVIPVVLLVIGQASGVIYFSLGLVFLLGVILWTINGVLLWFGNRTFRRGELISRL